MDTTTIEDAEVTEAAVAAQPTSRCIQLGVTRGMSNEDYHADSSAVCSSQLKQMLVSPAHYRCEMGA